MTDPIQSLHKMSPTAGVSKETYVEVNPTAVIASLIGLLAIVLFVAPLLPLLAIPAAGVLCAVVAWRQINNSAGTQTGRGLAIAGLVLSLVAAAWVLGRWEMERIAERHDGEQVDAMLHQLGDNLKAQDFTAAYSEFSDEFHKEFAGPGTASSEAAPDSFTPVFHALLARCGPVESVRWNGIMHFGGEARNVRNIAQCRAIFRFAPKTGSTQPDRAPEERELHFDLLVRRTAAGWKIEEVGRLFPHRPKEPSAK